MSVEYVRCVRARKGLGTDTAAHLGQVARVIRRAGVLGVSKTAVEFEDGVSLWLFPDEWEPAGEQGELL